MPKFDVMLYPFMLGSCMPSSTHGLALVMLWVEQIIIHLNLMRHIWKWQNKLCDICITFNHMHWNIQEKNTFYENNVFFTFIDVNYRHELYKKRLDIS
jgi:hypothetical protein